MPANVVKTPEDEQLWSKAKKLAAKEGRGSDYAYIMGIFQKMTGKKSMAKSFTVAPAWRSQRVPGQVPRRESMEMSRLLDMPKARGPLAILDHTEPRLTTRSVVDGLGMNLSQESEWSSWVGQNVGAAANEVVVRKALYSKFMEDKTPPELRRAIFQRSLNYYSGLRKSVVQIVTADELLEKARKDATPIGGKTKSGLTVKMVGGKRTYVQEKAGDKSAVSEKEMGALQALQAVVKEYYRTHGNSTFHVTVDDVAEHLGSPKSGVATQLSKLVDKGLVRANSYTGTGKTQAARSGKPGFPTYRTKFNDYSLTKEGRSLLQDKSGVGYSAIGLKNAGFVARANFEYDQTQKRAEENAKPLSAEGQAQVDKIMLESDANAVQNARNTGTMLPDFSPERMKQINEYLKVNKSIDLSKAEPRGGTYYRRVPADTKKGYRYIYDPEKYHTREDAHLDGDEALRKRLKKMCVTHVQGAGENGCGADVFKEMASRFGADKVAASLKEATGEDGPLQFDKGCFKMRGALKKSERFTIKR